MDSIHEERRKQTDKRTPDLIRPAKSGPWTVLVFRHVFFVSFSPFILFALCKSYIVFVGFCTEIIWDTQAKYITHKSICCIHSRFTHMFSIYAVALNLAISVRARWIYMVFQYLITNTVHFKITVGCETTKQGIQQPNRK